jgi:hypothetical protein
VKVFEYVRQMETLEDARESGTGGGDL